MRLPISDNWHTISYHFEVISDYCSNFWRKTVTLRFEPLLGKGLGATCTIHRLIEKLVVDFLFVLIELFFARCYGWGATSEYWLEIGVFEGGGSVSAKFSCRRGRPPRTIFARIDRSVNALQLCRWQYSYKKNFFSSSEVHFLTENGHFAFWDHLLGA